MHFLPGVAIQSNLELKTWPKQLLGSLLLVIALPDLSIFFSTGFQIVGSIKLTNKIFGSVLFVEIGNCLFNLSINVYFISTFYTLITEPFEWVVLVSIL